MKHSMNWQLVWLVVLLLFLSIIFNTLLIRNIRRPIKELTKATRRFHDGDMTSRSSYHLKNEFGNLSASFNSLAENIEENVKLNTNEARLADIMLSEDDERKFFQNTLCELCLQTGSQIAAVYLLSDDKSSFDHFESIGLNENARQSFNADNYEGESGIALSSRKIQHISNLPENTKFIFNTVCGNIVPREMITIPIVVKNEVIAILSLASMNSYTRQSMLLVEHIHDTLSARIDGIIAYQKIKDFSEKLETQNRELEAQKIELVSQSAELMEQNTELEMQKNQLDEASKLKTNFLSNMSHELRTPLNSVIALSTVLNRRLINQIPEEEYSYLEVIERNGKHLLSLINDILDISRIEAGREEIELTSFSIDNEVADVINMLIPQAKQKNIELSFKPGNANILITSDARKCNHILENIIGNAIKFTEKGKVDVALHEYGQNVEITITDTGIGISGSNLPFIFDEYRQVDNSTARRFGGTGLGLAIAKKYSNILGGIISVKSTIGKGSEFTVSLPKSYPGKYESMDIDTTKELTSEKRPFSQNSALRKYEKTILLVDDSEPVIIQMKDILIDSGYELLVARNGTEALDMVANTIPDAIILDLMMPGMDGFELLKILRDAEPTAMIPVLILSAKQITKEELGILKRNNVHQLIQKGDVNRMELLNAVESMVYHEKAEKASLWEEQKSKKDKPVVLIVEDNPDSMTTTKAVLFDNFTLMEAVNGLEAIEMAKKHIPDLILMDIELPVMNGIDAFKVIRKETSLQKIPVIALTASAMASDRETILAHGFDAFIAKPIDETIFFNIIKETLYG